MQYCRCNRSRKSKISGILDWYRTLIAYSNVLRCQDARREKKMKKRKVKGKQQRESNRNGFQDKLVDNFSDVILKHNPRKKQGRGCALKRVILGFRSSFTHLNAKVSFRDSFDIQWTGQLLH